MATIDQSSQENLVAAGLSTLADIESLLPAHTGTLSPAECNALALEIAASRDHWDDVQLTPTESTTRAYALLYEDERVEVWLLSWSPGHTTGFHDHGVSNVGFCITQGVLGEQYLRFAEPPKRETLAVGDSRAAGSDYIHCLEWESGSPALSVHVYSPPLHVVGQYRVLEDGVLRRESQAGRDELTLD